MNVFSFLKFVLYFTYKYFCLSHALKCKETFLHVTLEFIFILQDSGQMKYSLQNILHPIPGSWKSCMRELVIIYPNPFQRCGGKKDPNKLNILPNIIQQIDATLAQEFMVPHFESTFSSTYLDIKEKIRVKVKPTTTPGQQLSIVNLQQAFLGLIL